MGLCRSAWPRLRDVALGTALLLQTAAAHAQVAPPPAGLNADQQLTWQTQQLRLVELAAEQGRGPGLGLGFLIFLFLAGSFGLVRFLANKAPRQTDAVDAANRSLLSRWADLPLGAPDGSVRALLSMFIIVFGFYLLAFQKPLGMANGEALAGFIGAVISFYFVSRSNAEAREANATAQETLRNAGEVVRKAGETVTNTAAAQAATGPRAGGAADAAAAQDAGANAASSLADARERLVVLRAGLNQVAGLLPGEAATAAAAVLNRVTQGVEIAEQVARGDAAGIAAGATAAAGLVGEVLGADNPLTTVLGDAVAGLRTASGLAAMAGIGGPPGLLIGVAFGAVAALRKGNEHYERWKARIIDRPYTRNLFPPDGLDGAMCLAAIEQGAPTFKRVLLDTLAQADPMRLPRAREICKAAQLDDAEARRALDALAGGSLGLASEDAFATALNELRRAMLDVLLGQSEAGEAPAPAPAGLPVPPPAPGVLRSVLDRLREEQGAKGLDPALLLLTGLAQSPDMTPARLAALLGIVLPTVTKLAEGALREGEAAP
jgi:hypothetical protein